MENSQNDMLESVRQMNASEAARVTTIEVLATTEARNRNGLFAERVCQTGGSIRTLQDWEQGRRGPSGAAKTLLRIASQNPEAVKAAA